LLNLFDKYVNKVPDYAKSMDEEDQSWSVSEAIAILKNAMKENKKKASEVFSSIDVDDDGKINGPELYKGLIEHIGHYLSPGQVSMIINALDTNDDNRIDLAEFSVALEEE
jgi:Ca2+-binding EF-hand superfamily protein